MQTDYQKLSSENSAEETKKQIEQMQSDLERIKTKEQALDAENKILRAQLFSSSKDKNKKSRRSSVDRASDYQALPGERSHKQPVNDDSYARPQAPISDSNMQIMIDEEPVKLKAPSYNQ